MRQIPGWPSRWFPTWTANTRSTGPATPSSSSACRRNVLRCRECRCITPDSGPDTAACGRMAEASRAAATMGRAPGAHSNFTVMVQAPMRFGSRTLHGAVSPIRTILRRRSSMMRASPVPFLWVLLPGTARMGVRVGRPGEPASSHLAHRQRAPCSVGAHPSVGNRCLRLCRGEGTHRCRLGSTGSPTHIRGGLGDGVRPPASRFAQGFGVAEVGRWASTVVFGLGTGTDPPTTTFKCGVLRTGSRPLRRRWRTSDNC